MANATCRDAPRDSNAKPLAIVTHLRLRRGVRMHPVAGEDATCREGLRVTIARGIATRRICHRVGSRGKAPCLPVLFYAHLCPLFSHVPAGVSEGRGDPRGMCGVPIGTLRFLVAIRGLQTLGYSCGVAPPLLPLAGGVSSALRAWLACAWRAPACRVRGSQGPPGDVWSTCRHSPLSCGYPRVTNPRLLLWSGSATLPPCDASSAGALPLCLAGGVATCVVRVCLGGWRGDLCGACLPCGWRGWRVRGVPRLACPRVSGTLGGCVEYLSALSRGVA